MEGRVGVAARSFAVLALAGAGFGVGYALAPHHAATPPKTGTAANGPVSIIAPPGGAAVPTLATGRRHEQTAPSTQLSGGSTTTTQGRGTATAHASATRSSGATQATGPLTTGPSTQTTTPPRTGTGSGTSTDEFGFHPAKPPQTDTSTSGTGSSAP